MIACTSHAQIRCTPGAGVRRTLKQHEGTGVVAAQHFKVKTSTFILQWNSYVCNSDRHEPLTSICFDGDTANSSSKRMSGNEIKIDHAVSWEVQIYKRMCHTTPVPSLNKSTSSSSSHVITCHFILSTGSGPSTSSPTTSELIP